MKRIKLNLSDGTHMIPAIVASQLYDTALKLELHDIIQIDKYNVNRFDMQPSGKLDGYKGFFLLVTEYTVVRTTWLTGPLKYDTYTDIKPYVRSRASFTGPVPEYVSSTAPSQVQTITAGSTSASRQSHHPISGTRFQNVPVVACSGNHCSAVEGQVFNRCMLHTHEIPDVCDVLNECWFVEEKYLKDHTTMEARLQRNVIYWWFATNMFGAMGKHNRITLPSCLIAAIRNKHPNTAGEAYSAKLDPVDHYARKCGQ